MTGPAATARTLAIAGLALVLLLGTGLAAHAQTLHERSRRAVAGVAGVARAVVVAVSRSVAMTSAGS